MTASEESSERMEVMLVPGIAQAVGSVRRCLRDLLGAGHPALEDVLLCQSEIMTNALRHTRSGGGGQIRIAAALSPRRVRVEITDDGGAVTEPQVVRAEGESGRGLALVQQTATDWGFDRRDGRTTVWFTITIERCPAVRTTGHRTLRM